ncbi:hypothetical protein Taro_044391 [Colocasia esculenta]|uniref:Retrotransposon gag domain-containing protein n=1 Tax=Colocasia esculenta TaxID=4460 RepID=A0A843WLT1_COLES|nr:hypothetical protein [Colocasia esculenta]
MSLGVRSRLSSRPPHLRVLYFPHRHQWIMECSCRAQVPVPQAQDHGRPSIMERFRRMLPPSFKGESDPLLAESWMREIKKIIRAVRRELMCGRLPYCVPNSRTDRMEQKFLSLTEGSKTILEYEARFAELSKYAPHIVADERRKAKKFVMGLKPSLRTRLVAFDHRTLDEALSPACRQEGEMEQYLEEKKALQRRPAAPFQWQVLEGCFFLLKMKDFDAILSLDWLEEHYALVDFRRKRIVFRIPAYPKIMGWASSLIGEMSPNGSQPSHQALRETEGLAGDPTSLEETVESYSKRGVPTHEDEQRQEERGEQQAPAPQGPTVLPPPPPMDYGVFMQGLVQAMQTQAHTYVALQAQLEAQAQAQAPAPVPQEHRHDGPSIMERFKRMAPPSFKGESQPLLAECWMREIEKIFRAIRCAEDDKERADVWWSSLQRTRFEDGAIEVAWDEFVRLFRTKFIPEHIQYKMEQKFLTHTQGSMTILEYEARFAEFSKYAPHIVADERRKDRKKAVYQSPQRPVTVSSQQEASPRSHGVRPSGKKECPYCGRTYGGNPVWSASPSSASPSSASYMKTRKASSPSSSVYLSA